MAAALYVRSSQYVIGGTACSPAAGSPGNALGAGRRILVIQNQHGSQNLFVRFDGTAVADATSFRIAAGGTLTFEGEWCPAQTPSFIASGASTNIHVYEG